MNWNFNKFYKHSGKNNFKTNVTQIIWRCKQSFLKIFDKIQITKSLKLLHFSIPFTGAVRSIVKFVEIYKDTFDDFLKFIKNNLGGIPFWVKLEAYVSFLGPHHGYLCVDFRNFLRRPKIEYYIIMKIAMETA